MIWTVGNSRACLVCQVIDEIVYTRNHGALQAEESDVVYSNAQVNFPIDQEDFAGKTLDMEVPIQRVS